MYYSNGVWCWRKGVSSSAVVVVNVFNEAVYLTSARFYGIAWWWYRQRGRWKCCWWWFMAKCKMAYKHEIWYNSQMSVICFWLICNVVRLYATVTIPQHYVQDGAGGGYKGRQSCCCYCFYIHTHTWICMCVCIVHTYDTKTSKLNMYV